MSEILIRGIPDDVLAALDQLAARMGLSCIEYIRRRLIEDARAARISVTPDDCSRFTDTIGYCVSQTTNDMFKVAPLLSLSDTLLVPFKCSGEPFAVVRNGSSSIVSSRSSK